MISPEDKPMLELGQTEKNHLGVVCTATWFANLMNEVDNDFDKAEEIISTYGGNPQALIPYGPVVFASEEQMSLFLLRWS